MFKLLAGLFLWGAKTSVENKQRSKSADIAEHIEQSMHFQPEDPIPEGVVDIESWKLDIKEFRINQVIDWYRAGKYKKIIKERPIPFAYMLDWNRYHYDCERFKHEPKEPNGKPYTVHKFCGNGMYDIIWPEDDNGNFVKEWPDQKEWEKIKEEQTAKMRTLQKQKDIEYRAWEKAKYGG